MSTLAVFPVVVPLIGDPVAVRQNEGLVHGFLVLRDLDNHLLASGELLQTTSGGRITNDLLFHFKDGSLSEETVVFTQQRAFRVLSWRLVQKGPSFKQSMNESVNGATGETTIRYDDGGKEKTIHETEKLPPDLANGMVPTLLKNIDPKVPRTMFSMLVATPKPRLVKLEISPAAEESFSVAGSTHKAMRFVVHVSIGGVAGAIAPLIGKQPPDTKVWIVEGKAPGFLKSEGPMYEGGPIWRIELASPEWAK